MSAKKEKKKQAENILDIDKEALKEMEQIFDEEIKKVGVTEEQKVLEEENIKLKKLEEELAKVKKELTEKQDKFLRLLADFENFKNRNFKEMSELRKYANEKILGDMLVIVDNFNRALNSVPKNENENNILLEGIEMTLKEIFKIFEKYNVKPIEAEGKTFDPVFHQAMMKEKSNEYPENTVINELQKGYMICDRLLRPAMVVVSEKENKNEEKKNE